MYCCNNELHCNQCNNCNQIMSVALLKCHTHQETTDSEMFSSQYSTTMPPTTMIPITPPSSVTTSSTTETTTAQHNQSTAAESPRPDDNGSIAAVIVVLVLAMATGCIITCAVVVWKRLTVRKNSIKLRYKKTLTAFNLEVHKLCNTVHTYTSQYRNYVVHNIYPSNLFTFRKGETSSWRVYM